MNQSEIINELKSFNSRLINEVAPAYDERGNEFGDQRFLAFRRSLSNFIKKEIPSEINGCNQAFTQYAFSYGRFLTDSQNFWKNKGADVNAYIDSLIIDIENDEFDLRSESEEDEEEEEKIITSSSEKKFNKVFIVHGHNGEVKLRTARFIEKLGFEAIILHEKASRGKTIIEKIEYYTDVNFAIVLYTPDDLGNTVELAKKEELQLRARQNVVFEHGYLMAKIGRENVVALVSDSLELPNDISGVVYVSNDKWEMDIANEMSTAGYDIDFNKLYKN
ncbi:nucleotide-binding protein [Serratia marcescens]